MTKRPSARSSTGRPAVRLPFSGNFIDIVNELVDDVSHAWSYRRRARADARVDAVRAFNRFYTARIGVLGEGLLARPTR